MSTAFEQASNAYKASRSEDEDLRELLSYCKVEAEKFDPDDQHDEFNPYDDLVYRLTAILDGEQ